MHFKVSSARQFGSRGCRAGEAPGLTTDLGIVGFVSLERVVGRQDDDAMAVAAIELPLTFSPERRQRLAAFGTLSGDLLFGCHPPGIGGPRVELVA
jgi:hypothetical protein